MARSTSEAVLEPPDVATNPVDAYARQVVDGLPAGKYHRRACERHLKDRGREGTESFPFVFDWQAAQRFFRFAAQMRHYKGRWAGEPFTPSECQVFRLGCIFGWRTVDGKRRFTTAYNELPRKSGKSFEAAIVALYVTFFEGEAGAEGYCIATKEKQAKIVFDDAKKLVTSSGLRNRITVLAKNLHRESTSSKLEPIGSDSDSTDGLNPQLIVTDEFHAHKTRALINVMESALGARDNPLHFQITTAGDDPVSPGGEQHEYACQILDGVLADDPATLRFFAFIAHADPSDDPWDEVTWRKANPQWGISVNPDEMREYAARAKQMAGASAEFKQKRLNLWVNSDEPWLSIEGWKAGQGAWDPDELKGERCFVGVDLASKIDLLSMSFLFPPTASRIKWRMLQYIWTPKDTLPDRARRDRAPYAQWVDQKWLHATDGTEMDYQVVRQVLKEQRSRYRIEQVGFDPWHADKIGKELISEDGFKQDAVILVSQTYAGMSSAAQHFEAAVLAGKMDARGCPVTAWAVSNAVVQRDGKDNIYPVKKKSRGRIDPVMSAIIAMSLAQRALQAKKASLPVFFLGGGHGGSADGRRIHG
jgi:phage terminase large subunit-like protein